MIGFSTLAASLLYLSAIIGCLPLHESDVHVEKGVTGRDKYRLPNDTAPIHYDIRLDLNFDAINFTVLGETAVDFEVRVPTSNVVLNSKYLVINESATSLQTKTGYLIQPTGQIYDDETQMLHVQFNDPLEPGVYTLNFKYETTPKNKSIVGLYKSFYMNEHNELVSLAVTHFQPFFARRAFPCWDEPALKATFNISLKHFSNYTALSNMPAYAREYDQEDQKVWTRFERTPIMSTNILGFIVADYANLSNSDGTMKIWTKKHSIEDARYVLEIAEQATAELRRYLNSSVRVPKMDHVSVPRYSSRATENWGLIVYHESAFLHNNETGTLAEKLLNILTVTHELAHQWFGNLVSPAWWKYYWMSEGMATYLKYYIIDKMFKEWRLMDLFVVYVQQKPAFLADERSTAVPLNKDFSSPEDIMLRDNTIIYRKSSSILRMLSHIVSEDVFRSGLIKYIAAHEYSSVTSDDLWEAMQEALDESDVPNKISNLKEVMSTWVEQPGYPLVTVIRDYRTGVATIHQEISPTNKDFRPKKWWVPLNYVTTSKANFSSTLPTHWLGPIDKNISIEGIDADDWIIVNVQEIGYYRVNYDPTNWRKIAKYLNSDDYENIHIVNRAQIIDDSFNLMLTNRLSPVIFLELTNYLSRETNCIPWASALNILSGITNYLKHPIGEEILKPHILELMNNFIESIGYEERPDDDDFIKLKRYEILVWACKLGDRKCKVKAAERLAAYLNNPKDYKVSPDSKYWTYCMGLMTANQTTWDKLFNLERGNFTYETLRYLGCSQDLAIIENYLNMSIANDTVLELRAADVFTSIHNELPTTNDVKLNFLINNWNKIKSHTSNSNRVINDLIWSIDTSEQLDKLKTFLQANQIPIKPILNYSEEAIKKLEANVLKIRGWFNRDESQRENESIVTSTSHESP